MTKTILQTSSLSLARRGTALITAGIATLALAVVAGQQVQRTQEVPGHPQAFDSGRQVLFVPDARGDVVRVLSLRHGIGELKRLQAGGGAVRDVKLDASGRWLWVLRDQSVQRYDAYSLAPAGAYPLKHAHRGSFASVGRMSFDLEPPVLDASIDANRVR